MFIISVLPLFNCPGFMVEWYSSAAFGLTGGGAYVLPISFLASAILIIFSKKKMVSHRIVSLFLLPVLFGSFFHLLSGYQLDPSTNEAIKDLFISGRQCISGGVLSGGIAIGISSAISRAGAYLLFILLIIFDIFVSFNIKIQSVISLIKNCWNFIADWKSELYDYYEEEDEEYEKRQIEAEKKGQEIRREKPVKPELPAKPAKKRLKTAKSTFDIPINDNECTQSTSAGTAKPDVSLPFDMPSDAKYEGSIYANVNTKSADKSSGSFEFSPEFKYDGSIYREENFPESTESMQDSVDTDNQDENYSNDGYISEEPLYRTADSSEAESDDEEVNDTEELYSDKPLIDSYTDTSLQHSCSGEAAADIQYSDECAKSRIASEISDFLAEQSVFQSKNILMDNLTNSRTAGRQMPFSQKSSAAASADTASAKQPEKERSASNTAQNAAAAPIPEEKPYSFPPVDLLAPSASKPVDCSGELKTNSSRLIDTLSSFNIEAHIVNITRGPSVTRYEIQLNRGVKYSRITSLSEDIALSLGASNVRIAPIPDKMAIGIEVPNTAVETVYIRDVISSAEFKRGKSPLTFAVGKDISGMCVAGDISKMPHMLIAGTTGSGKSVCINSMLISLLYKSSPEDLRLIMVDPKMIELGCYNGIPHLLIPVVTDPKKAAGALGWAVTEMMKRYKLFSEYNVRDLDSYNAVIKNVEGGEKLPRIVIVIDELADLMLVAAHEVEEAVCRIAQMARAAGMHLIIATQRPSADVITGLMKANIPSRIAFAVASQIESRIILDTTGAEKLIGRGDMLFYPLGFGKPLRVQGCLISSPEVEAVVNFVKQSGTADYSEEVMQQIEKQVSDNDSKNPSCADPDDADDEIMDDAIGVAVEVGSVSVSMLQRKLKLGYSRAARIVDQMEERGIVGPYEGAKPRAVLISKEQWNEMMMRKSQIS